MSTNHNYENLKETLSTLFLGDNDITELPSNFFNSFRRLLWLNLDDNLG